MFVGYARAAGLLSPRTYTLTLIQPGDIPQKASFRYVHGAIAVDVINKRKLIGLLDFHFTVIGGNVDRLSCHATVVWKSISSWQLFNAIASLTYSIFI